MLKKISNAEWAKIAALGYEREERSIAGYLRRQLALRKFPISMMSG